MRLESQRKSDLRANIIRREHQERGKKGAIIQPPLFTFRPRRHSAVQGLGNRSHNRTGIISRDTRLNEFTRAPTSLQLLHLYEIAHAKRLCERCTTLRHSSAAMCTASEVSDGPRNAFRAPRTNPRLPMRPFRHQRRQPYSSLLR